jgi:hypothetical protein
MRSWGSTAKRTVRSARAVDVSVLSLVMPSAVTSTRVADQIECAT